MNEPRDGTAIPLAERLEFLAGAGVITATARLLTSETIARLVERLGGLDAEDGAPLVTHIAMALTRVERGEPEAELPAVVEAEIRDRVEDRAFAESLAARWREVLRRPIPDSEVQYVVVHLATLEATTR